MSANETAIDCFEALLKNSYFFMNQLRTHRRLISSLMFLLMAAWQIGQPLQGATFYWDTDGSDVSNDVAGTNLGGTGDWDLTAMNWWDGTNPLVVWPNSLFDTAIFNGTAGVVTLGSGINVGTLMFQTTGYQITGANTLTLGDVARVDVAAFSNARIDSVIAGSAGLLKTGNGTLFLGSAGNTYMGDTVITGGALVITDQSQLGSSTNTISVYGIANTGNPGFSGGTLVVDGSLSPVTITREIGLHGRGPGAANNSGALVSIGNNTFNGDINIAGPGSEARAVATHGITTVNGDIYLGSSAANVFHGNGNWIVNGRVSGSDTAGDRFVKTGNSIGSTLWLTNPDNDFRQTIRVDSGSVRVSGPNALAALGVSTSGQSLDSNGGYIEIHSDSLDFSTKNFRKRGNGGGIFVDHDFGSTLVGQTILFRDLLMDANAIFTLNGRNGFGLTFTPVDGKVTWTNGGNATFTNNSNGVLTIDANVERASETGARSFIVAGHGEFILTGNLLQLGTGDVTLDKRGRGTLTIGGNAGTYEGITNIREAHLSVSSLGLWQLTAPSRWGGTGGSGLPANTVTAALEYTGAGEVSNKVIDLQGTTGGAILLGNGTGGLTLTSNLTASGAGAKTLTLGGSYGDQSNFNIIAGAIVDNGGANTTSVLKFGSGSWVLSGANTYTGNTTVTAGILALADTFSGSSHDVLGDSNAVIFDASAFTQTAGGVFAYAGDGANASVETIGSLAANAGAGTVVVVAGAGGTAALTFGSLGAIANGSTINFVVTDAGSSITLTGAADTSGILDAHLFFNGADFASGSTVAASTYISEVLGNSLAGGNSTPYLVNTVDIASQLTATINAGIKFDDTRNLTIAGGETLTINNGANTAGGILVTGGSSVVISGGAGITSGGSGDLVFRTDSAGDTLTLNTAITSITTGGWTKSGVGTLVLGAANANTTVGKVSINEGIVQLSTGATLGANSVDVALRQGGVLDLNGVSLGSTSTGTGPSALDELNGAGVIKNSGSLATLQVGTGNANSMFTGSIEGAIQLVKNGSGTGLGQFRLAGAQSYSGGVVLNAGNLYVTSLADIGVASGLGTGDATDDASNAASLVFSGGALVYTGSDGTFYQTTSTPSVSIDRLFTLAANGTIYSNGRFGGANRESTANHAALVFNNTAPIAFSGTGNRTLSLRGDSFGDNQINMQLIDNPNTGKLNIYGGGGLWILGNTGNSYTGDTLIYSSGILRVGDDSSELTRTLPMTSALRLGNTTTYGILQTSGVFTRPVSSTTIAGAVRWTGTTGGGGFAASTAPLVVNLGGASAQLTWGTGGFVGTGGTQTFYLSSSTSWADVDFQNPINLGTTGSGRRSIRVDDNGNTGLDYATLSGVISNSGGTWGLQKDGTGNLILGNANTYDGDTRITGGALVVTSIGNSSGTTASSLGASGGALTFSGNGTLAFLYVGGGETSSRQVTLTGGSISADRTYRIDSSGAGALTLNGGFSNTLTANAANRNLNLELRGQNTGANFMNLVLTNSSGSNTPKLNLAKADGGTWILAPSSANTFTGSITPQWGALGLTANGIGSASRLTSTTALFLHTEEI
ncbi:MAG: autotransporter-associated beta strand repeat-containing protein [Prosthecobacter sp.]